MEEAAAVDMVARAAKHVAPWLGTELRRSFGRKELGMALVCSEILIGARDFEDMATLKREVIFSSASSLPKRNHSFGLLAGFESEDLQFQLLWCKGNPFEVIKLSWLVHFGTSTTAGALHPPRAPGPRLLRLFRGSAAEGAGAERSGLRVKFGQEEEAGRQPLTFGSIQMFGTSNQWMNVCICTCFLVLGGCFEGNPKGHR